MLQAVPAACAISWYHVLEGEPGETHVLEIEKQRTHVGKTMPCLPSPNFTIFIGGMFTIPEWWFMDCMEYYIYVYIYGLYMDYFYIWNISGLYMDYFYMWNISGWWYTYPMMTFQIDGKS
jgi:hypothetical protein